MDDTINIANTCVTIGTIFQQLGEHNKAYDYLNRADSLYNLCGKKDYRIKNRLNLADILNTRGQNKEAIALLKDIMKQPEAKQDTAFMLEAYSSLVSFTKNIKLKEVYSHTAYQLAMKYRRRSALVQACTNMGSSFADKGMADSAIYYYRKAWKYLGKQNNHRVIIPILNGLVIHLVLLSSGILHTFILSLQECMKTRFNWKTICRKSTVRKAVLQ